MTRLSVRNLKKSFGGVHAVDGISFDVAPGELLALIGPNGAGKSTTFDMVGGQLAPSSGSIRFNGKPLDGLSPRQIHRLGVGRTFQIAATFLSLTVLENVQMALLSQARRVFTFWSSAGSQFRLEALALLEQVGMADQAYRPCSELAYGDVKRVELAMALANSPQLLLMDEPTAGMAPKERHALMALTKQLVQARQLAVLFTEHSMDVVFANADRILVLARGRLIAEGSPAEVRANPAVQAVYFGTGSSFDAAHTEAMHTAATSIAASPTDSLTRASETLLDVHQLNAWYGGAQILFDVALTVGRGEVVALMGRNGAGKSTTLKAIMGLLAKRKGSVRFMGHDISRMAPFRIARLGLGFVPEDRRIFTDLTVSQNLEVGRQPPRHWPDGDAAPSWEPEQLYALFPNLDGMRTRPASAMSGGEQQMLTVGRTLMGNPYLILLDEPSEGVAPVIVDQMVQMILALKARGASLLLCEQNMHFAALVADRVYVLEKGQVSFEGAMADLTEREDIQRAYLTV